MADWTDEPEPTIPQGRTPGKYIVYILGAFLAVFLGVSIFLAVRLEPAADRFHNPTAPSKK